MNRRKDFKKIAQSLGIAIPASLLFAGNVNATPAAIVNNSEFDATENIVKMQKDNEVINRITLSLRMNEDGSMLAHNNAHTDVGGNHTDYHSNTPHANNHTNKNVGTGTMCTHSDVHTNRDGNNSHTNYGQKTHTNNHTNKEDGKAC